MEIVGLSLKVAFWSACLVVPPAVILGYWLSRVRGLLASLVEAFFMLPLVLPPVATGYALLIALSPESSLGAWLSQLGIEILLNWKGAVLAACVISFPLTLQMAKLAFQEVAVQWVELAEVSGAPRLLAFSTVTLPLARRGLLAAWLISFGRALGEFGATIIVAGNIPGLTQTLPLALYTAVESGHDQAAGRFLLLAALVASLAILALGLLRRES